MRNIDTSSSNVETSKEITQSSRNKDFCFFCENYVSNFARHVIRNHSTEIEVLKIVSKSRKSKERRDLIALLRKKGNYLINSEKCVRPVKKSEIPTANFLPCTFCLGFYSRKRHKKKM